MRNVFDVRETDEHSQPAVGTASFGASAKRGDGLLALTVPQAGQITAPPTSKRAALMEPAVSKELFEYLQI